MTLYRLGVESRFSGPPIRSLVTTLTNLISGKAWSLVLPNILSTHVLCKDHSVKSRKRQYCVFFTCVWGTRWRSWLRHRATYKPEGRGFDSRWCRNFSLNPSGPTMALGSTKPLTKMSTRNTSWGLKAADALC